MEDIRNRVIDLQVKTEVQNASFVEHKLQNQKDFEHIDDCIHRTEADSKGRDDHLLELVKDTKRDVEWLKNRVWWGMGATAALVLAGEYFIKVFL